MIADLLVQLVRMHRRETRCESKRSSSSSRASYGSFCRQAWSGEGSEENPIVERDVVIHMLVPLEDEELIPVPTPVASCGTFVEGSGEKLVEWDLGKDSSGAKHHLLIFWKRKRGGEWRGIWLLLGMKPLSSRKGLPRCNFFPYNSVLYT